MGADYILDHRQPLPSQLASYGYKTVDFIANFNNTDAYWASMAEMIRPQGAIVAIVENTGPLDLNVLKSKSVTFVWEFMFTRAMYQTTDMHKQGELLNTIAAWIDDKNLRTTLTETLSPICAAILRKAHATMESGLSIGKIVLEGFLINNRKNGKH
jgi:NADPH:quinone reductase-like Zn-dependent oxidoreductase